MKTELEDRYDRLINAIKTEFPNNEIEIYRCVDPLLQPTLGIRVNGEKIDSVVVNKEKLNKYYEDKLKQENLDVDDFFVSQIIQCIKTHLVAKKISIADFHLDTDKNMSIVEFYNIITKEYRNAITAALEHFVGQVNDPTTREKITEVLTKILK